MNVVRQNHPASTLIGVFAVLLLSLFPLADFATADSIEPVFNDPPNSNGLTSTVTDLIDGADDYVYLAAYSMNHEPVVEALVDAHEREGVDVRVVTEDDNRDKGGSYSGFASAYDRLDSAGVTIKTDDRSSLMHHKFVVVDDETVFTGSTNFTESQFNGDKNFGVEIQSSSVTNHYKQEFLEMWSGNFSNDKTNDYVKTHTVDGHELTVGFSPGVDGTRKVLDVLNTADINVMFNIFTFTHDDVANRMIELHENGVDVRGTFDSWQATDSYYVSLIYDRMLADSVPVRRDSYSGLLHGKYLVADGQTSSSPTAIAGSYNWTVSANDSNDENFLIIRDPEVANQFYDNARDVYENHAVVPDWQEPIGDVVNINTADEERLTALDGVGTLTASDIVSYRTASGPFRSVDDLTTVNGVGSTTVDNNRDRITVGDVATTIDLNKATMDELEQLEGIGLVTAGNILDYRTNNGDFTSVDELTNVDGIGGATVDTIRDDVHVSSPEDDGSSLVDINTATSDTLTVLDGIGSFTAGNIVAYRTSYGLFSSKDQLTDVDGIGEATLDGIRDEITLTDPGDLLININDADTSTLTELDGIGTVTAGKIVEERSNRGLFDSVDDLTRVDGIGSSTVDSIRSEITVQYSDRININSAKQDELETLDGIGPSTADNIVNYRSNNGGFSQRSDLKDVDGIGETTYNEIKDRITT